MAPTKMRRVLDALPLPTGLHRERIHWLHDGLATSSSSSSSPQHLLYWMQTSVRSRFNYSLEFAVAAANALSLPLHVVYFLSDRSVVPRSYAPRDPNAFAAATERHAKFAIEGLASVAHKLHARGLSFQVLHHRHHLPSSPSPSSSSPSSSPISFWIDKDNEKDDEDDENDPNTRPSRSDLLDLCARDAALVITDRPYLRPLRDALRECVASAQANARPWGIVQVEGDVVVPCQEASPKEEYAARTIRPKIHAQLKKYLVPLDEVPLKAACQTASTPLELPSSAQLLLHVTTQSTADVLKQLDVDRSVRGVATFLGGEAHAQQLLAQFLTSKLPRYATDRNEPSGDGGSDLSLYLRHGHASAVDIALQASAASSAKESKESFLEELIVRRELAVNMCHYNAKYDTMACLPEYATITLHEHASDTRDHVYDVHALEKGESFDGYWNAAQLELVHTGKMHGYMRMYWAKKILEWTTTPQLGFRIALYLNNKYALDAPDPNSYTGIAWSFGKHDQGWKERAIFGKVRYMNEAGLKRKFRMDAYVAKVKRLAAGGGGPSTVRTPAVPAAATKKAAPKRSAPAATKRKAKGSKDKQEDGDEEDVAASMAKKKQALEAYFASKKK